MQIEEIGSVFSDIVRNDHSLKRRAETTYRYLNRSADEHAARMRALIEKWHGAFPAQGRHELRRRLQLGGNHGFESAFHELFLNALANVFGCRVEVHPGAPNTERTPDFSICSPEYGESYLEAVLATNQSHAAVGARQRQDTLLDGLDDLDTHEYYVGVKVSTASDKPASANRLRRFVSEKFQTLDRAEVEHSLVTGGIDDLPRFIYEEDGWTIEVTAFPKSPRTRGGEVTRAIGIEMTGVCKIDPVTPIRNALKRKAGRYGNLGRPYIIAVNALDMFAGAFSFEEALFGTQVIQMARIGDDNQTMAGRNPDGLWCDRTGPQYCRVSGVLFTRKVRCSNMLIGSEARLYLNPWAEYPYAGELTELPRAELDDGNYVMKSGISLEELLGVGNHWRD